MTEAAGTLYGAQPAPRVLFVHDDSVERAEVEALVERVSDAVPTFGIVSPDGFLETRQRTYGLAVVIGDCPAVDAGLHVLQFGGERIGEITSQRGESTYHVVLRRAGRSYSTQWVVPNGLSERAHRLVVQDLLRLVPRGNVTPPNYDGSVRTVAMPVPDLLSERNPRAIIVDADGQLFAMRYARTLSGSPWHWVLPAGANRERWLRCVLAELHDADAVQFPIRSTWSDDPRYLSSAEVAALAELAAVDQDEAEAARRVEARRSAASSAWTAAQQHAENGVRRLVSAQGDELSTVVADALGKLGFDVHIADAAAQPGDKLHDLLVRPGPGSPEAALAEVRAYVGGAQLNDLLRIGRFVSRYAAQNGAAPTRQWYIANQFVGRAPTERGRPLASNPAEVATFAEVGGLVVGTPDLLELLMRVDRNELTATQARDILWDATGYFALP